MRFRKAIRVYDPPLGLAEGLAGNSAKTIFVVIDRPAVDERRGFATKLVYPSVTGQHST